jgi:hypothetical protein
MYEEEDIQGDVPLMMLVKGDTLCANTARIAELLAKEGDDDDLRDVLTKLSEKVTLTRTQSLTLLLSLTVSEGHRPLCSVQCPHRSTSSARKPKQDCASWFPCDRFTEGTVPTSDWPHLAACHGEEDWEGLIPMRVAVFAYGAQEQTCS